MSHATEDRTLKALWAEIRRCRRCLDAPERSRLPHEPRPVLQPSATAKICVIGQAPGTRVHASGKPFTDPSGKRLRDWMGVDKPTFYDSARLAIVPMGFCLPGQDARGGDLPPRRECAPLWRSRLFELMPQLQLLLLIGQYAQRWHLGSRNRKNLTGTVIRWRDYLQPEAGPACLPLPHPSWRNNGWLKRHAFFEAELLPELKRRVAELIT